MLLASILMGLLKWCWYWSTKQAETFLKPSSVPSSQLFSKMPPGGEVPPGLVQAVEDLVGESEAQRSYVQVLWHVVSEVGVLEQPHRYH